jgi:hypothetical protein
MRTYPRKFPRSKSKSKIPRSELIPENSKMRTFDLRDQEPRSMENIKRAEIQIQIQDSKIIT